AVGAPTSQLPAVLQRPSPARPVQTWVAGTTRPSSTSRRSRQRVRDRGDWRRDHVGIAPRHGGNNEESQDRSDMGQPLGEEPTKTALGGIAHAQGYFYVNMSGPLPRILATSPVTAWRSLWPRLGVQATLERGSYAKRRVDTRFPRAGQRADRRGV